MDHIEFKAKLILLKWKTDRYNHTYRKDLKAWIDINIYSANLSIKDILYKHNITFEKALKLIIEYDL